MLFSVAPFISPQTNIVFAQSVSTQTGGFNGLIPCGRSGDAVQDPSAQPCTTCHALVGAKRLMDYLTSIMVVVAITVIVAMGVLYIFSGVSTELNKKSKAGLTAVFTGLVLMLSAWLIVSTILRFTANEQFIKGGADFIGLAPGDGTYGLQCNTHSTGGTAKLIPGQGVKSNSGDYAVGGAGTGTCAAPATGNCSPQALSGTCFGGSNVDTWAAICQAESGGSATIPSGTDVCTGDKSPVSFGLFQINISANKVDGLDCPSAFSSMFTAGNKNCRVTNRALYDKCVAAAKNPQKNIAAACGLAAPSSTNTTPWGAARRCNIPKKL